MPFNAADLQRNYRPMGAQKVGLWDDFHTYQYIYAPKYVNNSITLSGWPPH